MDIHEIQAKTILQRSRLPETEYVINPYTGCVHACVYCYARFMKRFTDHPEPWGSFLDVKVNAPDLLERQLARRRAPLRDRVLLSSVTDPYQPPEKKYGLTGRILEILHKYGVPVSILTKSDLVLRDIDLLARFSEIDVGFSLGTIDDEWARLLEGRASAPFQRLSALRALRGRGISTSAFVSPYIPGVSDIRRIVAALAGTVGEFAVEAVNTDAGNWRGTLRAIARRDPAAAKCAARKAGDPRYWRELEAEAESLAAQAGMSMTGFFHHRVRAQSGGS
jgi:DNA repair photolyase